MADLVFQSKVCPRCGGTMFSDHDWYGSYHYCVACGNHQDESPLSPAALAAEEAGRAKKRFRRSFRWSSI